MIISFTDDYHQSYKLSDRTKIEKKMKILLPYLPVSNYDLSAKQVTGGVERFCQLVYNNIPNVIPVYINKDEPYKYKIISSAAREYNVDVVMSNYEQSFATINLKKDLPEIPILHICHLSGKGLPVLSYNESMINFTDFGGTVFMVSQNQYQVRNEVANRVLNRNLKVSGVLPSAFCTGTETVNPNIEYPVITIGRISRSKNAFWLHKKSQPINLHSLVITGKVKEYLSVEADHNYYLQNIGWKYPQETKFDLDHQEVLNCLSKSGIYVSTWTEESFGITALEALSHGCPLLLLSTTGSHSSECIPSDSSHYQLIKPGIKSEEFLTYVKKMTLPYDQRVEISGLTKEKHTREKWCQKILDALDCAIQSHKMPKQGLTYFFNDD